MKKIEEWKFLEEERVALEASRIAKVPFTLLTIEVAPRSKGTVACHGSMPRPNNGHVCDAGVFCLEDWHFGSTLSGTFSVFDPSGSVILAKDLSVNVLTSGISRHGKYAFCATANSPTEHGNKVFLFDLVNRVEMYSITPKAGWPDSYEVDEGTGELLALFKDMGSFRYSIHGLFMDADQLGDANLNSSRYDRIILAAEKTFRGGRPDGRAHAGNPDSCTACPYTRSR